MCIMHSRGPAFSCTVCAHENLHIGIDLFCACRNPTSCTRKRHQEILPCFASRASPGILTCTRSEHNPSACMHVTTVHALLEMFFFCSKWFQCGMHLPSVHACVCVSVCVCVCVSLSVCVHTCIHTHIYTYIYMYVCICVSVYVCVCVCVCTCSVCVCMHVHTHIHACMYNIIVLLLVH